MVGAIKARTWPVADRRALFRRGLELALVGVFVTMVLGFISQQRHVASVAAVQATSNGSSMSEDVTHRTMDITQHHLFGESAGLPRYARLTEDALSLAGIIYSTDPAESRAMLLLSGTTTIVGLGTVLPDGSKVTAITANHIDVEREGITQEIALKIDTADPNAHFQIAAVDSQGNLDADASGAPEGAGPRRAVAPAAPMTQIYHATAVPLSAIRGKGAGDRFKGLEPPVIPVRKAHRP